VTRAESVSHETNNDNGNNKKKKSDDGEERDNEREIESERGIVRESAERENKKKLYW